MEILKVMYYTPPFSLYNVAFFGLQHLIVVLCSGVKRGEFIVFLDFSVVSCTAEQCNRVGRKVYRAGVLIRRALEG
jgi:hypothetical protein